MISLRSFFSSKQAGVVKLLPLLTTLIVIVAVGCVSCAGRADQDGEGNVVYTIQVNSDTEGEAFGPVQFQFGNAYLSEHQYAEAVRAYTTAINNGYTDINVYINRGIAYMALEQYAGAISDANVSLDMNNAEIRAYRLRGQAYLKTGKYQDAVADFSSAIALDKSNKEDYLGRGMAYTGISEYDMAAHDFDQAILIDPGYPDAYYWRAHLNGKYRQDYSSALNDYAKVIDLNGKYVYDAYNGCGETYYKLNDFDRAISEFSVLLTLKPDYWLAYYNRGLCYAGTRQYQQAVSDFKQYLALDTNNKYGRVQSADYLVSSYKPFVEGNVR
ncbi:MAG: tetratricopeptide repeat protein [Dehalococcoidia bacterium]|nr:MAG: tetratricopeptide repeat protein [Dehalococcoidia bacterium]